jgi:murein DD-endopeptidase MepM/ murein hydrolase activator NlpD
LGAKKITLVFLSDGSRKVRQFKFSKSFLGFLFLFFLTAAIALAWVIRDYHGVKAQIPQLAQLEKENKQQKAQLVALVQKIDQISEKMIELKEFDYKLKAGIGGSDPAVSNPDYNVEKAHKKLARLMHRSIDNLKSEISIRKNEKVELWNFLETQRSVLASTPSIWPIRGWISSRFGYRISPFTNEKEFHRGLDISSRMKSDIVAPADGVVSSITYDQGYGNILTLNHGHGMSTRYAHLSKVQVKKGQYVKRGQKIALVGNSGRTTGPHLHYEVHLNGLAVNPLRYILN